MSPTTFRRTLIIFIYLISNLAESRELQLTGNQKTHPSVVETELELRATDEAEDFEQTLKRTGLFSEVKVQDEGDVWKVDLKEKWTTIPITKFNSGGGVQQTTVGVYDPHVFGRRVELGGQYEMLDQASSHVFWFKKPRLFSSRFFSDIQAWNTQRIRFKFNPDSDEPKLAKAFLQSSQRLYLAAGYELPNLLRIQLSYENQNDDFDTHLIPRETLAEVRSQVLPPSSRVHLWGLSFSQAKERIEGPFTLGQNWRISARYGSPGGSVANNFSMIDAQYIHSHRLAEDTFFHQRFSAGGSNAELIQFWNYLGGLDSIRGYRDNRFAAQSFWLINSELRQSLLHKPQYILQSIAFVDLLGIRESKNRIEDLSAGSYGIGIRVIAPKIYRLVVRADFAQTFLRSDDQKVSFGIQQFF